MSTLWANRGVSSFLLSLPIAVWVNDCLFSFYRVQGTSMEPNLKHGDVVLVRKSDFLPNMLRSESLEDATERARILRRDDDTWAAHSWLLHQPPFVSQGDVVVFRSPSTAFPNEYNIKRIIAQGGQLLRPPDRFRQIEILPPYSVWLEGDNQENSEDSATYGALSKKLLVGKVERIVWPPTRWGKIERIKPPKGRAWWS